MNQERLFQAAGDDDVATIVAMLNDGIDPNSTDDNVGHSPLYNACAMDRPAAVQALLDGGADPNLRMNYHSPVDGRKENGVVALMFVRSAELADLLIAQGADVNAVDDNGLTPLIRAAHWGKTAVVKTLLAAGADATLKTNKGRTARDVALARIESYREMGTNDAVAQRVKTFESIVALLDGDVTSTRTSDAR